MSKVERYKNPHIKSEELNSYFEVDHVPAHLARNLHRFCFQKLAPGMLNPHKVNIGGIQVIPVYDAKTLAGKTAQLFRIEGFQRNFAGHLCYRIHRQDGDEFGRCVRTDEVIIVSQYDVKISPNTGRKMRSTKRVWLRDNIGELLRARAKALGIPGGVRRVPYKTKQK